MLIILVIISPKKTAEGDYKYGFVLIVYFPGE